MKPLLSATNNPRHIVSGVFLAGTAVVLVALQMHVAGWMLFLCGAAFTAIFGEKVFRRDMSLLYLALFLLGIAPITTNLRPSQSLAMSIPLVLGVLCPYLISRFVYKDRHIRFKFNHGRNWYKTEILYIAGVAAVTYLLAPIVARLSQVYLNWTIEPTIAYMVMFLFAMILVGIWDEFFFMATILNILKRYFTFKLANLLQSIIFSSFLYHVGFRSWTIILLFIFTWLQGRIFLKTESLFYLISIHVVADTVLTFVIINAHYPNLLNIFLIK